MARRRRRRGAARDVGGLIGLAVVTLAVCGILGGGAYLWATSTPQPDLDPVTLCPVDGPQAITVILIDSSDPLPDITRREVLVHLSDIATTAPEHGRVDLRVLVPEAAESRLLFSRCNPGDGSGLDEWTANPAMARKRWVAAFETPLAAALDEGLTPVEGAVSPIMATIQQIAVDSFTGRAVKDLPKALVVVSDMIENTPSYSQYRGDLSFNRFAASPALRRYQTDLNGAAVTLFYLERATARIDSVAHVEFWARWVSENGGSFTRARKLQGAG